jgi:hypothetical protein
MDKTMGIRVTAALGPSAISDPECRYVFIRLVGRADPRRVLLLAGPHPGIILVLIFGEPIEEPFLSALSATGWF